MSGAMMMRLGRVRSPIWMGSKSVAIGSPRTASQKAERISGNIGNETDDCADAPSQLLAHVGEERLDDRLVALEEHPLTDFLRRHEAGLLERGQMRRDGRLRERAVRVDLARADAVIERKLLIGEMHVRLPQAREDLATYGIGQRLVDGVEIELRGRLRFLHGNCIVTMRILYRISTI
ncbi:hypothetical protein PT2222_230001 [Paraburkholderia tropica]